MVRCVILRLRPHPTREKEVDTVPEVVEVGLVQPLLEAPVDPQPQQDPEGARAEDLERKMRPNENIGAHFKITVHQVKANCPKFE